MATQEGRPSGRAKRAAAMFERRAAALDAWQQRHPWAAFPYAVYQKFSDDQAGTQAALLAYYAFFSIFPLLLVAVTVLGFVLQGDPGLRQRLEVGAQGVLPFLGGSNAVQPLTGSVLAIVVGAVLATYNGLAVAQQAQVALNTVYDVPRNAWPGLLPRLLRSLGAVVGVGAGLLFTTLLSGVLSSADVLDIHVGAAVQVLGTLVALVVNTVLFTLVFRDLTVFHLRARDALPGAAVNAVVWLLVQRFGTELYTHELAGAQLAYGTFATVIGLLSTFAILAQVSLFAAEINAVRTLKLWPRGLASLVGRVTTPTDQEAYRAYAERDRLAPADQEKISVSFEPQPPLVPRDDASPGGRPSLGP